MKEFDIWADDSGSICATEAVKPLVYDCDAPYTFSHHFIRVEAKNKKEAILIARKERKKARIQDNM
ncbi:TPA: hypothetical protein ACGD4M_002681 [Serratia marcescens]